MCVFSSHSFWASSSLDVTSRGHTRGRSQDFSSTFFLRCVPEFFSREGFSHSFPSSTVRSNFVHERFNRSPLVDEKKSRLLPGVRTHVPPCQKVTRLFLSYIPGRLQYHFFYRWDPSASPGFFTKILSIAACYPSSLPACMALEKDPPHFAH